MLKNKTIQKYLSLLLVTVYAFVVLFSAKFHHHSHGYFDGAKFSKTEKSASALKNLSNGSDCIACHFLSNKLSFNPQDFHYEFLNLREVHKEEIFYSFTEFSVVTFFFNRRGPPASFI